VLVWTEEKTEAVTSFSQNRTTKQHQQQNKTSTKAETKQKLTRANSLTSKNSKTTTKTN